MREKVENEYKDKIKVSWKSELKLLCILAISKYQII